MEKCSNFENCGNTVPEVADDETPFQFCSIACKKFIIRKEKCTYPKRCSCEECVEANQIQQEFNYFLGERD